MRVWPNRSGTRCRANFRSRSSRWSCCSRAVSWGPSQPIVEVTMTEYWLTVRRGPAELDATTFRLADLYDDHFGFLSFPNQS